jgi:hypothetical protein
MTMKRRMVVAKHENQCKEEVGCCSLGTRRPM